MPNACKPTHHGGVATLVSFDYAGSDEPATPICIDMYPASRLDATATSPGLDESYATSRPGVLAWTNVTFDEAVLACGRGGRFLCSWNEIRATPTYVEFGGGVLGQSASQPVMYLPKTSTRTIDDHPDARILVTDVAQGVGVPDASTSVAFWTSDRIVAGRVRHEFAESGRVQYATRIIDPDFKHPLVGFRCCVDARLEEVFEPLGKSPMWMRASADPELPMVPQ